MYKAALKEHRFKAALGDNGSVQPGNLQELMLHETAVAWIRVRLARSVPPSPWEESREAYGARLKRVCEEINATLDVDSLCRNFVKRVDALVANKGERLAE